jgi:hypothetical protein
MIHPPPLLLAPAITPVRPAAAQAAAELAWLAEGLTS